jgi:hypothetical protein
VARRDAGEHGVDLPPRAMMRAMPRDYEALRRATVARLAEHGLGDPDALPRLSDDDFRWIRPIDQVVARCHALAGIIGLQQGADPDDVSDAMEELDLVPWLAGRELLLYEHRTAGREATPEALEQAEVDVTWRQEALWALLWALVLVADLPPDEDCGDSEAYERLAPGLDPRRTVEGVALRPVDELAAMLDLYYCLHWHQREHEHFGRRDWSDERLKPGVVWERREALEWLIQDVPWDEVDAST